jgi:hypothetical protein
MSASIVWKRVEGIKGEGWLAGGCHIVEPYCSRRRHFSDIGLIEDDLGIHIPGMLRISNIRHDTFSVNNANSMANKQLGAMVIAGKASNKTAQLPVSWFSAVPNERSVREKRNILAKINWDCVSDHCFKSLPFQKSESRYGFLGLNVSLQNAFNGYLKSRGETREEKLKFKVYHTHQFVMETELGVLVCL